MVDQLTGSGQVAATVQAMPTSLARRSRDRRYASQARECALGTEPIRIVTNRDQERAGGVRPQPEQRHGIRSGVSSESSQFAVQRARLEAQRVSSLGDGAERNLRHLFGIADHRTVDPEPATDGYELAPRQATQAHPK